MLCLLNQIHRNSTKVASIGKCKSHIEEQDEQKYRHIALKLIDMQAFVIQSLSYTTFERKAKSLPTASSIAAVNNPELGPDFREYK